MALALLLVPLAGALVAGLTPWRAWVAWTCSASVAVTLVLGVIEAVRVVHGGAVVALGGVVRIDALSAFMVIVIASVGLLATSQSARSLTFEIDHDQCSPARASLYVVLVQVFIAAMLLAVLAANVGVMWVAVEATTIVTTFLVGHRRTRGALEASWKYIIICSVGIAIAFLGTVLIYLADLHAGHSVSSLDWRSLVAAAPHLSPGVVRLGFALVMLGYGTKVGWAPMHTWLPDAHGQSPAPVSALMSGVLLSVAFYVVLRFKAIADVTLGPSFARGLLLVVGLLTLAVATSMLVRQRDLKRMFAYSSMEHVGLLALGAAAGSPLAIAAVLLHVLGHGLAKGTLFLASGEIVHEEGTSEIAKLRALLERRRALGGLFALGLVALMGLPPFSLFVSELAMFRAEAAAGLGWAVAVALACLVVIFLAVGSYARAMLFGARGERTHTSPASVIVPLAGALGACAAIGLLAWPLSSLLHAAAQVLS